ncbi:UNVERIFIED_CONTAM: hypothetical protein FKN15_057857 [Acipenser sinensis]
MISAVHREQPNKERNWFHLYKNREKVSSLPEPGGIAAVTFIKEDIRKNGSGNYTCMYGNQNPGDEKNISHGPPIYLNVQESQYSLMLQLDQESAMEGMDVSFKCMIPVELRDAIQKDGFFHLYKNGSLVDSQPIPKSLPAVTFSIKKVNRSDTGNYTCVYGKEKIVNSANNKRSRPVYLDVTDSRKCEGEAAESEACQNQCNRRLNERDSGSEHDRISRAEATGSVKARGEAPAALSEEGEATGRTNFHRNILLDFELNHVQQLAGYCAVFWYDRPPGQSGIQTCESRTGAIPSLQLHLVDVRDNLKKGKKLQYQASTEGTGIQQAITYLPKIVSSGAGERAEASPGPQAVRWSQAKIVRQPRAITADPREAAADPWEATAAADPREVTAAADPREANSGGELLAMKAAAGAPLLPCTL